MKHFIILMAVLLTALASCKKTDGNELHKGDYMIFGRAYGMCIGPDCTQLYKIENGRLYADDMNNYTYSNVFSFGNTPLPAAKYAIALPALNDFPAYMKIHPGTTWGCPDCHDQGGLHFALQQNGTTQYWHVDTDINEQPTEIRPYIQEVNNILNQLSN